VARLRADVVAPLRGAALPACRWDCARRTANAASRVPPLLVVEGVGAGAADNASPGRATSLLVWLDAPEEVRYRRAMERDGATYAPHGSRWAAQERAHFAADRTRDRADVVLTTG
jgi:cytidylate kinase